MDKNAQQAQHYGPHVSGKFEADCVLTNQFCDWKWSETLGEFQDQSQRGIAVRKLFPVKPN